MQQEFIYLHLFLAPLLLVSAAPSIMDTHVRGGTRGDQGGEVMVMVDKER